MSECPAIFWIAKASAPPLPTASTWCAGASANIIDIDNYMYAIVNCIGEFARAEV
jgi:hypothetical protein